MTQVDMDTASLRTISSEGALQLRGRYPYEQDERWVRLVAAREGWAEANRQFLRWHHDRGQAEMGALMGMLGVERAQTPRQAAALLRLAYEVFMPPHAFKGTVVMVDDNRVRVVVGQCPMFDKIERAEGHGPTACGSWHHRRGWFDAMGIPVDDSVMAERTWGEPACITEVTFG